MMIKRRRSTKIRVGNLVIGGGSPVVIQTMTKTHTSDIDATVKQALQLKEAGCEMIRVSVKDQAQARAIGEIKKQISMPVVADIHFHYKLALLACENGADKIRINPGNIRDRKPILEVAAAARERGLPLRIGANSGSLPPLKKSESVADGLVRHALQHVGWLEKAKFYHTIISLKASDVLTTVEAYRKCAKLCDYPLHLGITHAGLPKEGTVRSAVGLGALLMEGIGDTIRISLTDDPAEEIWAAKQILSALEIRQFDHQIISCPGCGRMEVDLNKITREVEAELKKLKVSHPDIKPLKVAVMGCVVNGPGEAREADVGVAAGRGSGMLFRGGKQLEKVSEKDFAKKIVENILDEAKNRKSYSPRL